MAATSAAGLRGGQGAGLLDGQAARRGPVGRAGDAVDGRGHRDPRWTRGSRSPRRCSGPRWSRRGRAGTGALALLSIADRDKGSLPRLAAALAAAGYRLAATPGTREALAAAGYEARPVAKLGEAPDEAAGEVPILDLIASGEVRLVVNTPTPRSGAVRDAAEIRLAATAEGILCLTAMETAVAAAEALDPAIAGRLADVRSLDEWVPREASSRLRERPRPDGGRLLVRTAASTTIAWPSDQSVSVVNPTITTASGIWRRRRARGRDPGRRVGRRHDVAGPGAEHVARRRPPPAGWSRRGPAAGTLRSAAWKAVPNRSQPRWNGSEIAMQDALAVDQQVGQVVGDQVAEGDRQQAGAGRRDADRPWPRRARASDDDAEERDEQAPSSRHAGRPEQVEEGLRLRQAVEQDRRRPRAPTSVTSALVQPGSSRPLPNDRRRTRPSSSTSANGARRPSRRNQTVNVSPLERHSSRPNWAIIASVKRCSRPGRRTAWPGRPGRRARARRSREADRRRPATEPVRVVRRRPAATPSRRRTQAPRSCSVENGSRKCQAGPISAETIATPTQP